jgi:ribosomal protein S27AE
MDLYIYQKGQLSAADCSKCGMTHYIHEWITDDFNNDRDAMQSGKGRCPECGGTFDADTFRDCGKQYAGRYSANGYMDCTDWEYDPNKRRLARALREMYGD